MTRPRAADDFATTTAPKEELCVEGVLRYWPNRRGGVERKPLVHQLNRWYRAAVEFGQNGLDGFSPDEGFRAGIVFGQMSIDRRLRSTTERKTPRRMRCRVILEKKFSTGLSQDAEVRVN